MIHTKLHKLIDAYNARAINDWAGKMASKFKDKPHFVLDDDLFKCVTPDDVEMTIDALLDADVLRTPYDKCVVELASSMTDGAHVTAFIAFEALSDRWVFDMSVLKDDGSVLGTPDSGLVAIRRCEPRVTPGIKYNCRHALNFDKYREGLNTLVGAVLCLLITLSHTRGVAREAVNRDDLARLNKARKSRGKAEIPPYTVFKIGHTYNLAGKSSAWHPGTKMRPHLRAGHVRQQVCGTGRKDRKLIFVEPVLVNCDTADNLVHVPKLVRA